MKASIGNGVTAILAGIVSQVLEDSFGHIGPFQGAIALTILALLMILSWEENYGDAENHEDTSLYKQFSHGWKTTLSHPEIWKIGLTQALSEGAMYTVRGPCRCFVLLAITMCTYMPFSPWKVCLYVGTNSALVETPWWPTYRMRFFFHDDGHNYWWNALSTISRVLLQIRHLRPSSA